MTLHRRYFMKNSVLLSSAVFTAVRLKPGDELLQGIKDSLADIGYSAAFIAACTGSLSSAAIRFAGRSETTLLKGTFELISLSGTLDTEGGHLHLSIADENGLMTGGHLMDGSIVRTTMELVIGILPDFAFTREYCALSTYEELKITGSNKGEDHYEK